MACTEHEPTIGKLKFNIYSHNSVQSFARQQRPASVSLSLYSGSCLYSWTSVDDDNDDDEEGAADTTLHHHPDTH